ncbi:hypothetical protein [Spiribacter onubensis]|uniref:Uncharacterized protein n=1 Tax=Spiribacter onubensis TaxID=3122420 RepID=A0ABV3S6Y5_9GAMM
MKKLIATAVMTAASLSTVAIAADDDRPEWLFVQSGDGIQLVDETMLVIPLEREIFAFTDRPARDHRYLNAHEFVAVWNDGEDSFGDDPPNAVLTWIENGGVQELEVELLDAKVVSHGRAIQYEIAIEEADVLAEAGQDAALYIDGLCWAVYIGYPC